MKRGRIISVILAGLLLIGNPAPCVMAEGGKTVRVDFSQHTGVPLFKRQNTFSVSYSFGLGGDSSRYISALPTLDALRSENMRVDLSMGAGGLGKYFAQGTLDDMTHQFFALDALLKQLYRHGTQPYFSYCYLPELLWPEDGDRRSAPVDYDAWKQLCYDIAANYEHQGLPLAAHEVWNEPDLTNADGRKVFYNGTWEEYYRIYDYAVRGIREANPAATVGGPSIAFVTYLDKRVLSDFFDYVQAQSLPLDFVSYHNYGTIRYIPETATVNEMLSAYGDAFAETALHINEFSVYEEWDRSDTASANAASMTMQAIARLVDMPAVTSVNWATWRDNNEGLSMLDNETGERSAVYYALMVYNDMPVDRVFLEGEGSIQGLASVDEQSAGVILYTRSVKEQQVEVRMDNLPFERVDVEVYAIDQNHSSAIDGCENDELSLIDTMTDVSSTDLSWSGTLGVRGILYLKILPAGQQKERAAVWSYEGDAPIAGDTATVARKEYYFADRSTTMFSEFDLGTFTAWAGMGDAEMGLSKGGVLLRNLPETLTVTPQMYGVPAEGSACFLYAQYCDKSGACMKETAYVMGEGAWQPEGFAGEVQTMTIGKAIVLETPEGFDGDLHLRWGIQDAGAQVALKLPVTK